MPSISLRCGWHYLFRMIPFNHITSLRPMIPNSVNMLPYNKTKAEHCKTGLTIMDESNMESTVDNRVSKAV